MCRIVFRGSPTKSTLLFFCCYSPKKTSKRERGGGRRRRRRRTKGRRRAVDEFVTRRRRRRPFGRIDRCRVCPSVCLCVCVCSHLVTASITDYSPRAFSAPSMCRKRERERCGYLYSSHQADTDECGNIDMRGPRSGGGGGGGSSWPVSSRDMKRQAWYLGP